MQLFTNEQGTMLQLFAYFYTIAEALFAVILYGIYRIIAEFRKKDSSFQITWRKIALLLITISIILITAWWATLVDNYSDILSTLYSLHFSSFPVMLATSLFYFFKSPNNTYWLFKIPMGYIFLGYVLLEVLIGVSANEFVQVFQLGLSLVYLVLGGISLALGPRKKEAANKEDLSEQAN